MCIEVYPLDVEFVQDAASRQVTFRRAATARHTATHAAISVPAKQATIEPLRAGELKPADIKEALRPAAAAGLSRET